MYASARRSDPATPARATRSFGRIGTAYPSSRPGRVIALPHRSAHPGAGSSLDLAAAARRWRMRQWQRVAARAWPRLASAARAMIDAWCAMQTARARERALRLLDDRTLRDLGITRSEIASLVAEVDGRAEPTRIAAMRRVVR